MHYWIFYVFLLLLPSVSLAQLQPDWAYVEKKLKKAKLEPGYIETLKKHYIQKDLQTVLKLNVLLFLKKTDYHGVQVSSASTDDVRAFKTAHKDIFEITEKDFGVSGCVIGSLLWMETRHGKNYGNFHVPSAYLHLLQAERKEVLAFLQDNAKDFAPKVTKKQREEIRKRTKKKADWALTELKALQTLYKKNATMLAGLYGSFSGAFGMPQFLPSSYKHWAKTTRKYAAPDLFTADDAIYSVGFYLKDHGWKQNRPKKHVSVLMKYNNSKDYAEAILKIAKSCEGK